MVGPETLWILKFECHNFHVSWNIFFFSWLFQPLRHVKPLLAWGLRIIKLDCGLDLASELGLNLLTSVVTCCVPSLPWAGTFQGKCHYFSLLLRLSFLGKGYVCVSVFLIYSWFVYADVHFYLFIFFHFFSYVVLSSEKAVAPHSSTLAWKIPWMEEPGRLQSMGSLRVGHDWATSLSLFTFMHWRRKWQPTSVFLPGESQGQRSLVEGCLWDRTESDMTEAT